MNRREVELMAQAAYFGPDQNPWLDPLWDALREIGYGPIIDWQLREGPGLSLVHPWIERLVARVAQGSWDALNRQNAFCILLLENASHLD